MGEERTRWGCDLSTKEEAGEGTEEALKYSLGFTTLHANKPIALLRLPGAAQPAPSVP